MFIISMKTMTEAMKAKRLLYRRGIEAEVVNLDANITKGGCAFGIRVYGKSADEVIRLMDDGDVGYGHVIGGWRS